MKSKVTNKRNNLPVQKKLKVKWNRTIQYQDH